MLPLWPSAVVQENLYNENYVNVVPKTREEIKKAVLDSAKFYHKELGLKGAKVKIGFEDMIIFRHGYMDQKKNHDGSLYYPIYINKNHDFYNSVATMAHEMVHVKQYHKKDFIKVDGVDLWKGNNLDWLPYQFRLWEMQAFHDEISLFNKYIKYKEYLSPGMLFKADLYLHAFLPYIIVLLIVGYGWILKSGIVRLAEHFGK